MAKDNEDKEASKQKEEKEETKEKKVEGGDDKEKGGEGEGDGDNAKADVDEGIDSGDEEATKTAAAKTADRKNLSEKEEDFQIRIKIIEGRQLAGANIKPVVKVACGKNQVKITRTKKGSSPIWEEMLVFNFKTSLKDLYEMLIEFTVNNSRKMRHDALIGSFKLDIGNVYDQSGHAYVRKWILLTDTEDSTNTPKGYLKATMCVLGAGDEPPSESGKDDDEDDVEGNLLTPAGASLKSANFILRVFKAEDVPQMDTAIFQNMKALISLGGNKEEDDQKQLVDPYLVFKFAGKKRKTKVLKETNTPEWNEELALPLKFPSLCDTLQLTVFDWDRVGSDDAIGTAKIPVSRISSTGEGDSDSGFLPAFGPTFVNIYGSPREFQGLADKLDDLNIGKGIGCAYRGRVMVELITKLEEEGVDPPPKTQPIEEEILGVTEKYYKRRRFRLVVALQDATMMPKPSGPVEFEVSIGNYGNKFDGETQASSSTSEPTKAVSDGTEYYFLPWGSKKPVMCVTSHWEDVVFRYQSLNVLLRLIATMEQDVARVKKMMDDEVDEIEVAAEIVGILNDLLDACKTGLADPRGRSTANSLDMRIFHHRTDELEALRKDADELRQTCTSAKVALTSLEEYIQRLDYLAYEPQSSIPDVIIWMLCGKQRVAYARIPAYEVLYSKEKLEYCGRMCGKMQTITLRYPTAKVKSKKNHQIACQLQASIWLGKAVNQEDFDFNSRGQIAVFADTYETEVKVPVKGWMGDGYYDRENEIELPKKAFVCPPGWCWDGDWIVSPREDLRPDDSGLDEHTEEAYEDSYRFTGGLWQEGGILNSNFEEIASWDVIDCKEGWAWHTEWTIDTAGGCDEEGWKFTLNIEDPVWQSAEKVFHLYKRRRWIRKKKCVDVKIQAKKERERVAKQKGWEYAITKMNQYHLEQRTLDMVRRRRWLRRMVAEESRGCAAIFNLDRPLVHYEGYQPPQEEPETPASPLSPIPGSPPVIKDEPDVEVSSTSELKEDDVVTEESTASSPKKKKKKIRITKQLKKIAGAPGEIVRMAKPKGPKPPTPKIFLNFEGTIRLQIRVYLYQGRDLMPMDQDSFSDPFAYVSFLNKCQSSLCIPHTLNPIWDQTLIMDLDYYGDLSVLRMSCPDVMIEIYDKDELGSKKFMGRGTFNPMLKFDPSQSISPRLAWYDIKNGNLPAGSVLAAAELLVESDKTLMPFLPPRRQEVFSVPPGIRPVLQRTAIEFVMWGVRNMKPFKLLSVDRPSVLIQIGDVEVRSEVIKNKKKCPNLAEPYFYLEANLPKEQIYCPPIVIRIKDHRKFGRRPTVGQHIIADISKNIVASPPVLKEEREEDEGFDDDSPTIIEIAPPTVDEELLGSMEGTRGSIEKIPEDVPSTSQETEEVGESSQSIQDAEGALGDVIIEDSEVQGTGESPKEIQEGESVESFQMIQAGSSSQSLQDPRKPLSRESSKAGRSRSLMDPRRPSQDTQAGGGSLKMQDSKKSSQDDVDGESFPISSDKEKLLKDEDVSDEEEETDLEEESAASKIKAFGKGLLSDIEDLGKKLSRAVKLSKPEKELREDEIDWWSKYYASNGDDTSGDYLATGMDTLQVYSSELEKQKPFKNFDDFIQGFKLFRGKQGEDEDDTPEIVGEFKGAIYMYPLPADPSDPMPIRLFQNIPPTDPLEVKVRVYVVRAFDLAPQDPNGLSDPYIKIKVGKKRILDRSNYIPNTLTPSFGRMFELDLILPMEKDLRVEVFDWDLIGFDDKIGETVIDLENRYLTKYKAWCGLPQSYCSEGINKWRDQMTPKEWLVQKAKENKWDEPVWNGNTCVFYNRKKYMLENFEKNLIPCKDWGAADERLALHILKTLPHVPEHVETRPLFNDVIPGIEQGRLQLWVDMFPKDFGEPSDPVDITPRKPTKYFMKVIVWNCLEIPMMDTNVFGEQMTDIYVKGWIGGLEHKMKKTDVHYRSLDGSGNFNWRFVLPFDYLPQEKVVMVSKKEKLWSLDKTTIKVPPVLYLQVWDNDLFGPNEYISEITLPMVNSPKCVKYQKFCTLKNVPDLQGNCEVPLVNLFDQKTLSGWWPLYAMKDGERIQAGKLEMAVEIVTNEEFEEQPSANARDEPNENPKLEKPKRPATSFAWFSSPFKSLRYIIWKRFKWIIITILIILLLGVFLALFFYTFPGAFTSWFLKKF